MMSFTNKFSPRAIGSGIIKNRVSRQVPTRNGSPYTKVVNGLTKINKVAKETRFKKRSLCKFSATALLIVSQTGINLLQQAIVQECKPVIHRRGNKAPLKSDAAMGIDEISAQHGEQQKTPALQQETPDQQETAFSQQGEPCALLQELKRPSIPALIVGGFQGKDIDIHQIHPSRVLTQNLYAWHQVNKWAKGSRMRHCCLSRFQMAVIERKKEAIEDAEEEERRKLEAKKPKRLQPGDSIKLWHHDWKAKEWQKKKSMMELFV